MYLTAVGSLCFIFSFYKNEVPAQCLIFKPKDFEASACTFQQCQCRKKKQAPKWGSQTERRKEGYYGMLASGECQKYYGLEEYSTWWEKKSREVKTTWKQDVSEPMMDRQLVNDDAQGRKCLAY